MPRQLAHWNKEFDRLSSMSDAEIYRELGYKVGFPLSRLRPGYPERRQAQRASAHGRRWLDRKLSDLKSRICRNAKLRQLIASGDYTLRDVFLLLVDILSSLIFYVPVGTAAMILARGGMKWLCGVSLRPKREKGGKT